LIAKLDHATKQSRTYLYSAKGRVTTSSTIAAASSAPCVLLSPASDIAETDSNKIKFIIVPPAALSPMDAVPPAATRMKKERKKAAQAATSDFALTAMPPLSTAPAMNKGKLTGKKKSTKSINLWTLLMWVSTTNLKKHCVVAIAHKQKCVAGIAGTITGNVPDEPLSNHQFYQKGPLGKRIAPGIPEYMDMLPLKAFLHLMPPAQPALMLELTNTRLAAKEKWQMT
jgi:hypothetical protein